MMSTADSYLLVSVQTFVHDLGKNFMPEMTEKHEILMSRIMSVVLAMGALIIALYIKKCLQRAHVCLVLLCSGSRLPALAAYTGKKPPTRASYPHDRRLLRYAWAGSLPAIPLDLEKRFQVLLYAACC